MRTIKCEQGSAEWKLARCGLPTASNFDKLICADGKPSKQRIKYMYQIAGERIIGKPEESYKNEAMDRGNEMEAEARQLYELITGNTVEQVGLCLAEGKSIYAASPDGLVGDDGLLEIKCPILSTHVGYLLEGKLPSEYFQQTQGQLLVTGRKWLDFLSYYPAMKPLLIRVTPDKEFQKALQKELDLFCEELSDIEGKLRKE
jgi:putative phage-type endonuclease